MADGEKDQVRAALEQAIGFQYEIIRLLGRGGMGAVYQAHERALDRPVAIKVLPPEVAGTAAGRERFLREARTAARLTHPNIVPLFTFGETAGLVYYVMGYVEGESLQQRLDRVGKLEPDRAQRILEQLAGALDYAHQQGIVHRDVKPDNVLLERGSGDAKLTDFGIAKRAAGGETLTGTGLLMGTPRYMSPEQASGDKELDARSDVYSLGLVGYAMLTGRPPFEGASVQETLRQQVMREAPSLRKLMPDLPPSIASSVERALAKDPKNRWQSAGALASTLGDEDDTTSMTMGERLRRPGVFATVYATVAMVSWNAAWLAGWKGDEPWFTALLIAYPFVWPFDIATARWKEKRSWSQIRRMVTEPPRWWPYWWPRRWRRTDDLWNRLPAEVRTTRLLHTLGVGIALLVFESIYLGLVAITALPARQSWVGEWVTGTFVGMLAVLGTLLYSVFRSWRWGRSVGLTFPEASRVANEPTARPKFWAKPHIARLLGAAPADDGAIEPRTHAELVSALALAARDMPDQHEIVDAARRLAASIDAHDAEIANLARESDPGEAARLEAKLAAPGNEEMRKLYASQLDLLRKLARQREDLESRRARYVELLRTLWFQVGALRAQHAADAMQAKEVSGRIREICRSVQYEVDGAKEADGIVRRD